MKAILKNTLMAVLVAAGTAASAQDAWSLGFKMGGGQTFQDLRGFSGNAGYAWGGDFELTRPLSKTSELAFTAGYRFFPGDFQQVSFAPATFATTGSYNVETRIRKADMEGFQVGLMYRENLALEGFYWQGGARVGFNKSRVVDTGSAFAITVTTANSAGTVTKVTVIDSQKEKNTFAPGLIGGLGYRFNDTYSLELNAFTVRANDPVTGNKLAGSAYELLFGIKF